MSVLIDYINDDAATIKSKFSSIQKRYFDPLTIRITTDTNKYVYIDKLIRLYNEFKYGKNKVICGFKPTVIEKTDEYIIIEIEPGIVIADGVLIEFTSSFQIKQSLTKINIDNTDDNIVYVDYTFVETYPPNVALVKFEKVGYINEYVNINNVKVIVSSLRINDSTIVESLPDYIYPRLEEESYELNGIIFTISPYKKYNSLSGAEFDQLNTITKMLYSLITENSYQEQTLIELTSHVTQLKDIYLTSPITIQSDHQQQYNEPIIFIDASNNDVTLKLNKLVKRAVIKRLDNSGNKIYIIPDEGSIDGKSYIELQTQYDSYTIIYDNNNWFII